MRFIPYFLLPIVLLSTCPAAEAPSAGMQSLADLVDGRCRELSIPGLALAVVEDDQVILEHCYGLADPVRNLPVDPRTVFPVGSTSKPFTSTLAARLVSDGDLDWDDPITDYLPWFKLRIRSDDPAAEVLIRDLLSHRTGIVTMELVQQAVNWQMKADFTPPFDREGILRAAVEIEPTADFRQEHHYSNLGMIAVAEACARATGTGWDELMKRRLFTPLGMTRSGTSSAELAGMDDVAVGHLPGESGYDPVMALDMDCIAPAGGVWSCLEDMIRFLRFLLQEGELDGKRLIDAAQVRETWTEHIGDATIDGQLPGASYGLGWFLFELDGLRVVEHGGNALGYSANLVMIPEKKVGYVMLSNALPNPLQMTLSKEVWRALGIVD